MARTAKSPGQAADLASDGVEAQLRRSREQYAHLVASIDGIVWEADADTLGFTFVSDQAERLLGYPRHQWIEEPDFWVSHIHPEDRDWVVEFCRRSTKAGKDHDFEYRMLAADGRTVWLRDLVSVATSDPGKPVLRGIMVDVTARRRKEAELRQAEERFRSFVENLSDVVYALDREGNFLYCSPAIEQVSSYKPEEVIGRPFAKFVDDEDLPALAGVFARVLAGESHKTEYRAVDKSGERRWVLASISPTIEDGEVVGVTGVFSEITAQKRMIGALYESEARYRELVELSPSAIVVHCEGKIVFANSAAVQLAGGGSATDLLGLPLLELVHEDSRELAIERVRMMMQEGRSADRAQETFLRLDGSVIDVEVRAGPIMFHGKPSIQVIIDDVTEQNRIREEIQRLNTELEQRVRDRTAELVAANRELESFSYSVSHDLRAPLRVIEGFAQMFLEEYGDALDAPARGYLDKIHSTSARMDSLIHDLLAFSRMARASMVVEKVDLSRLARDIVAEFEHEKPRRSARFTIGEGLVVEGDLALLRIVMENLLGNAWKYTSREDQAEIEFGAVAEEGERVYFVRDNGVGFDMRFADKLFRPFQRLHAVGEFEGTGIGLATVQRIVERHGGKVWAEGEAGRGAEFRFTLKGGPRRRTG